MASGIAPIIFKEETKDGLLEVKELDVVDNKLSDNQTSPGDGGEEKGSIDCESEEEAWDSGRIVGDISIRPPPLFSQSLNFWKYFLEHP